MPGPSTALSPSPPPSELPAEHPARDVELSASPASTFARRWLRWINPVSVFVVVAGLSGLAIALFTPPFQGPDEFYHFYRAYQVSEGTMRASFTSTASGGVLPSSLERTVIASGAFDVMFKHQVRQDLARVAVARAVALSPDERSEHYFTNTAVYFPLVYFPQALTLLPARLLGTPPLVMHYLARLGGLVCSIALTALALSLLPFYRWAAALLSLTPMVLFQRAVISADGVTFGFSLLLVALCLRYAFAHEGPLRARHLAILTGCALAVALCKQAYLPLALLAFAIPQGKVGSTRRYLASAACVLGIPALIQLLWSASAQHLFRPLYRPESNIPGQTAYVKTHLFDVIGVLSESFVAQGPRLAHEFMGVLGWMDAYLPIPDLQHLAALALVVALGDGHARIRFGVKDRLLALTSVVLGILAIEGMLYLTWTAVGAPEVAGVQGRYLIPLAPALLLVFYPPRWSTWLLGWLKPVLVLAFIIQSPLITFTGLTTRYYAQFTQEEAKFLLNAVVHGPRP
ncbi:DUF2142 domain-containing protein [Myxococcaceae bacterium GXIMD 01537]